jgi:hypothetical protein
MMAVYLDNDALWKSIAILKITFRFRRRVFPLGFAQK